MFFPALGIKKLITELKKDTHSYLGGRISWESSERPTVLRKPGEKKDAPLRGKWIYLWKAWKKNTQTLAPSDAQPTVGEFILVGTTQPKCRCSTQDQLIGCSSWPQFCSPLRLFVALSPWKRGSYRYQSRPIASLHLDEMERIVCLLRALLDHTAV